MDDRIQSEADKYAAAMQSESFKSAKQKANEIFVAALDKIEGLGLAVIRTYRVGQNPINFEVDKGTVWYAPKIGHLEKFTEEKPENN